MKLTSQRAFSPARIAMAFILALFLGIATGAAHAADDPGWIAHRAIKMKILKEANDRYDVQFYTTHVDRLEGPIRQVTGKGRFRRRGKSPQNFTYHTKVNIKDRSDKITGYEVR